jgi:hypothetical protein
MKSEIIKRLFKEGHITIDEVIELSKEDKQITNIEWITQPNYRYIPSNPYPLSPSFVPTCTHYDINGSYKIN